MRRRLQPRRYDTRWPMRVFLVLALCATARGAFAQMGGAVVIVQDYTYWSKWANEEPKWDELILNTRTEVEKTERLIGEAEKLVDRSDELLRRMGRMETAVHDISTPIGSTMKATEAAADLETEKHALDSSRNLYPPGSINVRLHNRANRVEKTFAADGAVHTRDPDRYTQFAAQEAMYSRYRAAATNEETVVAEETALQRRTLERLAAAKTASEVAVVDAVLAASRERLEIAHQKTMQGKADLDAFRGQLEFEQERKAEAEREWAQTVVERLRAKALAAYQAQHSGGGRGSD